MVEGVPPRPPGREPPAVAADLAPIRGALHGVQRRILPTWAAVRSASMSDLLQPGLEERLAEMSAARRVDFVGGRMAAESALLDAGQEQQCLVLTDARGGPVFPSGYVGSIAHKDGRAVAIVTKSNLALGIGIDLEFDGSPDEAELATTVVTDSERRQLANVAADASVRSPATLVLAAKEAAYKAISPVNGRVFDFDDLDLSFDWAQRSFVAVRFPGQQGLRVSGTFELRQRWLVAVAVATASEES